MYVNLFSMINRGTLQVNNLNKVCLLSAVTSMLNSPMFMYLLKRNNISWTLNNILFLMCHNHFITWPDKESNYSCKLWAVVKVSVLRYAKGQSNLHHKYALCKFFLGGIASTSTKWINHIILHIRKFHERKDQNIMTSTRSFKWITNIYLFK